MIHDEHADLDVVYASKRKMIMVMLLGLFSYLVAFFIFRSLL